MRRALVLLLLLAGMQLIVPLGTAGQGSLALLAFGFLILAAYTVGEIASDLNQPKIVGYMIAGILFGPSLLGTVTVEAVNRLAPVSQLAIALIAFLAGAELRWSEVRDRGVMLVKVMTAELVLTFVALGATLYLMRDFLPFLRDATPMHALALTLLFASIAIVHSPAATMALLTETRARGVVARSTLGIVLLADVAVVLLFSGAVALARVLAPPEGGGPAPEFGLVIWEIGGALLIGAVVGAAVARYLSIVGREPLLFGILIVFFAAEIARVAHVEPLLMLLVMGSVVENASSHGAGEMLRHALERSSAPLFIVFFALSGARIDLLMLGGLLAAIVPLVLARMGAIWAGTRAGARWAGMPKEEAKLVWLGLVSQAGVAIGLAEVVAQVYPGHGASLRTLLLALIAINQIVGPIMFRRALVKGGEIGAGEPQPPVPAASSA